MLFNGKKTLLKDRLMKNKILMDETYHFHSHPGHFFINWYVSNLFHQSKLNFSSFAPLRTDGHIQIFLETDLRNHQAYPSYGISSSKNHERSVNCCQRVREKASCKHSSKSNIHENNFKNNWVMWIEGKYWLLRHFLI